MSRRQLKISAATLLPAVATMLFVQACGGGGNAVAQASAAPDPVVGVWESQVTQKDCASGAVLAQFRGAQVYHTGGTLTDTSGAPPTSRGPGMGIWTSAGGTYTARFRFYRYNPDGSLAGSNVVTRTFTISTDGTTAAATTRAQVIDLSGTQLQEVCASDTAKRFS